MRRIASSVGQWWDDLWSEPSHAIATLVVFTFAALGLGYLFVVTPTGFVWAVIYILLWVGFPVEAAIRYRNERLARLRRAHICLNCGYDCRVTPGRCPECGRAPGELV